MLRPCHLVILSSCHLVAGGSREVVGSNRRGRGFSRPWLGGTGLLAEENDSNRDDDGHSDDEAEFRIVGHSQSLPSQEVLAGEEPSLALPLTQPIFSPGERGWGPIKVSTRIGRRASSQGTSVQEPRWNPAI